MNDWSPQQYLKFEEERTRPSRDLLAKVPLAQVRQVVDLGCGPGNSTELLIARYPDAEVIGLDSSSEMLRQARERLPKCRFIKADLVTWAPEQAVDLLFASAVFQWIPDHPSVLRRLLQALPPGGVLAVQIPDNTTEPAHTLMREVAGRGPWAANPALATAQQAVLLSTESYYDLLRPFCRHLEIWHTIYNHVMAGPEAIVDWFQGSSLRPFLAAIDASMHRDFLADYTSRIARHYQPRCDGRVLLRFPRMFIVATR